MFKKLGVKGDEVFGMDGGLEDAYYEDGGEVGEEEVVWSEGGNSSKRTRESLSTTVSKIQKADDVGNRVKFSSYPKCWLGDNLSLCWPSTQVIAQF